MDDDDGWLVGDAIKVLVIWKSPDAVPALIKRTNDNRFTVRHEAIKALGKLKDPRGVEPIILRIKDDGFQVEDALKEMGPIAEPALIERLTNPDSDVRRRVCAILKVIGGKETLAGDAVASSRPRVQRPGGCQGCDRARSFSGSDRCQPPSEKRPVAVPRRDAENSPE